MQVFEEPRDRKISIVQSRSNRPPTNIRGLKTDDELITDLGDCKRLIEAYTTYYPIGCDSDYIKDVYDKSIAEIDQRTSIYMRIGQKQRWLYLREQARQVLNEVSIEPQTRCKLLWDPDGRGNYEPHESHELVELYIRRKDFHKAEFFLEDIVLYFRDHPRDPKCSWYLSKLIALYTLSVDRIKRMPIGTTDKESFASISITDRIARIDVDVLSNRVIDGHLVKFQEESDLGMALQFAVKHGACNLARIVLDRGAHFGVTFARSLACGTWEGHEGRCYARKPLHVAVGSGHIDMVRLLVARGADIEAVTRYDDDFEHALKPLHRAVKEGRLAMVICLLSLHANIEARSESQKTPLMWAVRRGDSEVVRYLLDRGACVWKLDQFSRTVLHLAARAQQPANLRAVLDFGADIVARDGSGKTALHLTVNDSGSRMTECIDILVDNGVGVDEKDFESETALHIASRKGNSVAAEHLIRKGASLAAECVDGTPLHLAVITRERKLELETVNALLRNGADVNKRRSSDGKTPLHIAVCNMLELDDGKQAFQQILCVLVLCGYGPDVNVRDNNLKSALDYARHNESSTGILMRFSHIIPVPDQGHSDVPLI
ncbi:MAG: hypothetical protein Q9199_007484 [Rusavskia elegans]